MFTHLDRGPGQVDHGGEGTERTGLAGRRSTGLAALFGSMPFRQLAGPAGVFFLWPPKSPARTGTSPGGPL
jgi:hypothetical protein